MKLQSKSMIVALKMRTISWALGQRISLRRMCFFCISPKMCEMYMLIWLFHVVTYLIFLFSISLRFCFSMFFLFLFLFLFLSQYTDSWCRDTIRLEPVYIFVASFSILFRRNIINVNICCYYGTVVCLNINTYRARMSLYVCLCFGAVFIKAFLIYAQCTVHMLLFVAHFTFIIFPWSHSSSILQCSICFSSTFCVDVNRHIINARLRMHTHTRLLYDSIHSVCSFFFHMRLHIFFFLVFCYSCFSLKYFLRNSDTYRKRKYITRTQNIHVIQINCLRHRAYAHSKWFGCHFLFIAYLIINSNLCYIASKNGLLRT